MKDIYNERPEFNPSISGVRVSQSFCRSLFVLLSLFFWSLYYLSLFDSRLLITPLVSSDSYFSHNKCISKLQDIQKKNNKKQSCMYRMIFVHRVINTTSSTSVKQVCIKDWFSVGFKEKGLCA